MVDVSAELSQWPDFERSTGEERAKGVCIFLVRNAEANDITHFRAVAGRSFCMWIDRALSWPEGLRTPEEIVERNFDLALNEYLAICLAPAVMRVNQGQPDPSEAVFDPSSYFKNSGIPEEKVRAVLATLTFSDRLPPDAIDEKSTYWNHTDLSAHPYLKAAENLLIPASISRAFARGTTGVFWMIHEMLREEGDVRPLTNHFGHIFEDYGLRLLEATSRDRVIREIEYARGRHTLLTVDGLLSTMGSRATARIFVEFSALRPTQAVFAEGSAEAFQDYLDRIIEKLGQLNSSIVHHQEGTFKIDGDIAGIDDAYIPVLVIDKPFLWSPSLRELIDHQCATQQFFDRGPVARPVVCDIGEFENLCASVEHGSNLVDLLVDYVGSGRSVPLKTFLYDRDGVLVEPDLVRQGFDQLFELVVDGLHLSG